MTGVPNVAQEARWNGDGGRYWIAHRERHLAVRARLTPRLLAAAGIGAGDRVLDVGCGCGETTIAAARLAGLPALGLDLSGLMLDVARGLAVGTGARFAQGDAQVYPLPEAAFDVVMSSFGVMFFDDPAAAFANVRTALRPGGRLAFLCWQPDTSNELFGLAQSALPERPVPEPGVFDSPERISAMLAGVGYLDVRVEAVVEPARLGASVADVVGYTMGLERFKGLDEAAARRLREVYGERERADGVWVEVAAWLVTGHRGGGL